MARGDEGDDVGGIGRWGTDPDWIERERREWGSFPIQFGSGGERRGEWGGEVVRGLGFRVVGVMEGSRWAGRLGRLAQLARGVPFHFFCVSFLFYFSYILF